MAERLGEALLDLDTRDRDFNRGVDRAERKALGLGRTFDLTAAKAVKMGRNLALAAAAGTAALGLLVKKAIDHADAVSKAAARSGVATEALSRLAWAGDLSDVSLDTLTGSIYRLSNAMAQAASGKDKDLQSIFEGLGIALQEADGRLRSADAVLMDMADVFARLEDGADKTALAVKIFGRSGAQLIPLLNNGRRGLAEMGAEADRLGLTISTDMGKRAEQFNDTITRIQAVLKGMVLDISGDMLPALQDFADKLADPAFRREAHAMAKDVAAAFGLIADAIRGVLSLIGEVKDSWSTVTGWVEWLNTHDMFGNERAPDLTLSSGSVTPIGQGAKGDRQTPSIDGRIGNAFDAASINAGRTIQTSSTSSGTNVPPSITSLLGGSAGGGGISEIERQKQAVKDLIDALQEEVDVLKTSDPVQQEMIRFRSTLAAATPEQREEVERLVAATIEEREQIYALQDAMQTFGDLSLDVLDRLADGGGDLDDVLGDLAKSLRRMALQAVLLGQGPLAGLFGMSAPAGGGAGGLFGALGSLFSGFHAKGGLIPNGQFGIVGDAGPEPVIGTSRGAMVMPNSSLRKMEAGGGSQFNFSQTITPPSGFETRTREEETPGGKRQEIWFDEAVGSAIAKRGSAQAAVRNAGRLTRR